MKEIKYNEILSYKTKRKNRGDYSLGGFYLIKDNENNNIYVGRSIDVLLRLKRHIYDSKRKSGLKIDLHLSINPESFKYFIIESYINLNINYFSRKLETIYENTFINKFNTVYPNGLNYQYYDKLRIK